MVTRTSAQELAELPEEVRVCVQELLRGAADDHANICGVSAELHGQMMERALSRLCFGSMTHAVMASSTGVLAHAYMLTAPESCRDDQSRQVYAEAVAFLVRRALKIAMTTEIKDGMPVLPDNRPN